MKTSSKFWDKAAAKYAKSKISDIPAYEYTLGRTRSYLKSTDRVLELGAGTGSTAILLAPAVKQYTASDYSENMIAQAQAKPEADQTNLKFVQADIFDGDLAAHTYDVVLAHSLLHLVPDTPKVLAHIHRMIKPGGVFISKTACLGGAKSFQMRLIKMALPLAQFLGKAPYVGAFSAAELEAMVTQIGFEILESGDFPAGHPPSRYIVARRI